MPPGQKWWINHWALAKKEKFGNILNRLSEEIWCYLIKLINKSLRYRFIHTGGSVNSMCVPGGICNSWDWRCSTRQMFPSNSVVTCRDNKHSASHGLLFSSPTVVWRYALLKPSKNDETRCGSVIFTGCIKGMKKCITKL